jgi:mRNA interferase YafQ
MRSIEKSTQFKKDYRKASKSIGQSGLDERLGFVIRCLLADQQLPKILYDHALKANWKGHRDCHVFPDLALIYRLQGDSVLQLIRLGSHCDLLL